MVNTLYAQGLISRLLCLLLALNRRCSKFRDRFMSNQEASAMSRHLPYRIGPSPTPRCPTTDQISRGKYLQRREWRSPSLWSNYPSIWIKRSGRCGAIVIGRKHARDPVCKDLILDAWKPACWPDYVNRITWWRPIVHDWDQCATSDMRSCQEFKCLSNTQSC